MKFHVAFALTGLVSTAFSTSQTPLIPLDNGPHVAHARAKAPQIFNSLHHSMRQWGSSLQHNGMSYFRASIPAGTVLFHGTPFKNRTAFQDVLGGMDWMAFEIEHAEFFADNGAIAKWFGGNFTGASSPLMDRMGIARGGTGVEEGQVEVKEVREEKTYLHTYRTTRPLTKLLYIDGMAAAKTNMGTQDSQDICLCNNTVDTSGPIGGDLQRAQLMCALPGVEGIVRMEAGFELILCDVDEGLELVTSNQRPKWKTLEGRMEMSFFEYMRGLEKRFHVFPAGRVGVEYSRMVSAYFYGLDMTNEDGEYKVLPRLPVGDKEGILRLRDDVLDMFATDSEHETVEWQGLVDLIVTRYSDRLRFMTSGDVTDGNLLSSINFLLNAFIDDAESDVAASIETCATVYLAGITLHTTSDHLIYEAILTVTRKICSTLLEVRTTLIDDMSDEPKAHSVPNPAIQELMQYLDWSTFKECGKCALDEVCYTAAWPFGGSEDHDSPSCRKFAELQERNGGYWKPECWG